MTTLGFIVAIGLPLAVLVGVVFWPERIPPDRTVKAIRRRVESETDGYVAPPVGVEPHSLPPG